jgi:hypothetical protein
VSEVEIQRVLAEPFITIRLHWAPED